MAKRDDAIECLGWFLDLVDCGRECDGDEPVPDDAIALHYCAHGSTAIVTWGDLRALAGQETGGDE